MVHRTNPHPALHNGSLPRPGAGQNFVFARGPDSPHIVMLKFEMYVYSYPENIE
jgi:hypothetical protein